ncbi:phage tail tape measure protein [Citrobacter sp. BDA59-3]|uniref:phage tail tape measure protein n=1 Tax=Citrobacter sp. BDA59-3 TaxID=2781952 RepID=UPI0018829157|nr:phage tail tape measure protein [Citrobacter sp. BDA59-3]QOV67810.1 phage tail tape measure protein [Citrobacter sp. BDA59-3]
MSDKNLRLQVVLSAVDKLTRPFKEARASTKELAAAVKASCDALKSLDDAGTKLNSIGTLTTSIGRLDTELEKARLRAQMMTRELSGLENPTKKQTKAVDDQWRAVSRLETQQEKEAQQLGTLRAELYRMGISSKDAAGATEQIRTQTARLNTELAEQESRLKRAGEQQRRLSNARNQYSKTLEVRDRIAGASATTTAAGVGIGAPVVAAVKDYASFEDAMKGVAKQVNGLRDDKGNRTAQFYEMQKEIKAAAEKLPMQNGAIDYASLVEGGARMGIGKDAKTWEELKTDLLNFASVSAKAATAFELPADQLAENLGKIANLYKVPIKNIEQLGDVINYLDDNAMSKGADIIEVMQRMGGVADKLDFRKAAALGSTFLTLGAAPEVAATAANAMVRELSIASMQSNRFMDGMDALKLKPEKLEKAMTVDAMGTIIKVMEMVKKLPKDKQMNVLTQLFGKEYGTAAGKLANNMDELYKQLDLVKGKASERSMQKESDINADSLSAQWMLVKAGTQNTMSSLGETLRGPLMDIMQMMKSVTGTVRRWIEANPELAGAIMKATAAVAVLLVVLGTLGIAVAAVLGPLALARLSLNILGIKSLPVLSAAAQRTGNILSWLGSAPLKVLRSGLRGASGSTGLLTAPLTALRATAGVTGNALSAIAGVPASLFRGAMSGLSAVLGVFLNPLSSLGRLLSVLASGPIAVLRIALMGISTVLGILLSPIGLVVAALASVALVVWKYWEPISAFLSGVVEGFKAAAAPIEQAFAPVRPVFQWIGDKVQALFGWFRDLLTPVKSTAEELNNAASMGRAFGQALADGLNMVMHPLDTLKQGVSWLLEKLGIVQEKSTNLPKVDESTRPGPSPIPAPGGYSNYGITTPGKTTYQPYEIPMHDNGGFIPSGEIGIVGEYGPELVNGPANITSRRKTAALAVAAASAYNNGDASQLTAARMLAPLRLQAETRSAAPLMMPSLPDDSSGIRNRAAAIATATVLAMGSLAQPVAAKPLHPFSLPVSEYRESTPAHGGSQANGFIQPAPIQAVFHINQLPGESADDLVDRVLRKLEDTQRREAAARRGRYSDTGDFS